jgi:hypothetical protein
LSTTRRRRRDVRLEVGDRGLHRLGRLQHERQLHRARGEQLPTSFMPPSRNSLMMSSGGVAVVSASSRSASMPSRSPSTMRR